MKSTNQVHDAIERKAKERLESIADEMTLPLTKLHEQFYSSACPERYDLTDVRHGKSERESRESEINHLTKNQLRNVLYLMMKKAYLNQMVEKKAKELLERLELI
tara:strand:+ start:1881 stop:2195 length:315 start_codon:yes stop_codon:yes gene_type:complete